MATAASGAAAQGLLSCKVIHLAESVRAGARALWARQAFLASAGNPLLKCAPSPEPEMTLLSGVGSLPLVQRNAVECTWLTPWSQADQFPNWRCLRETVRPWANRLLLFLEPWLMLLSNGTVIAVSQSSRRAYHTRAVQMHSWYHLCWPCPEGFMGVGELLV